MLFADLLFFGMAVFIILTAAGMILSRNSVYSALFLVLNFGAVALLYIILGAPFIAMAQVTVYAGAIMVLFLFVIMVLGTERLRETEKLPAQRVITLILGVLFIIATTIVVVIRSGPLAQLQAPPPGFASPADIGMTLYQKYALPFEVTSVILLVALVGAIVLTRQNQAGRIDFPTRRKR